MSNMTTLHTGNTVPSDVLDTLAKKLKELETSNKEAGIQVLLSSSKKIKIGKVPLRQIENGKSAFGDLMPFAKTAKESDGFFVLTEHALAIVPAVVKIDAGKIIWLDPKTGNPT